MGTPDFAVPSLRAVAEVCDVPLVVTQPDRPRGRGMKTAESEVASAAAALGLPVDKPADMKAPETRERLAAVEADLFAVVAFGAILTREMLAAPKLGCVNLHGSLLPDYRGASPVQRALWEGRSGTGVTTMWIDEGLDMGDCILQRWIPVEASDTAGSLTRKLAELGAPLLAESLLLAHQGKAPRRPQDRARGSYAKKLGKRDGWLAFDTDAESVWNRIRAVTPWPGATAMHRKKRVLVVAAWPHHRLAPGAAPGTLMALTPHGIAVACDPGVLLIERVKPEGRSEMNATDWARGAHAEVGDSLRFEEELS